MNHPSRLIILLGFCTIALLAGCNTDWEVEHASFRDFDGDQVHDPDDNCLNLSNPSQSDFDGDGLGDACDPDKDNDFLPDDWELQYGLDPLNAADAEGDADQDGLTAREEFALGTFPNVTDMESDGAPDGLDNCPFTVNPAQDNLDGDDQGDACDADIDGDGFSNQEEIAAGFDPYDSSEIITPPSLKRISVNAQGQPANGYSLNPDIAADGSRVVFASSSTDLVGGDHNSRVDIFVTDTTSLTHRRISQNTQAQGGNRDSVKPMISANGTITAWHSSADNLVTGDTNEQQDVFFHDAETNTVARANVASDGSQAEQWPSFLAALSPDGERIYFNTNATNLADDLKKFHFTLIARHLDTASTSSLVPSNNAAASHSADRIVVESPYAGFCISDRNDKRDIFLHNPQNGDTIRLSESPQSRDADHHSMRPHFAASGNFVVFESDATNLVWDDTNQRRDIFLYDVEEQKLELISKGQNSEPANDDSYKASVSADGRFVAFSSDATNLVDFDFNNARDIFVYDRQLDYMRRINVNDQGVQSDRPSEHPQISDDGRCVAFTSAASNLDTLGDNESRDIYLYCRMPAS